MSGDEVALRDRDIAEITARTHECPDCHQRSRLAARWRDNAEQVWCPTCGRTTDFRRRESLTAAWKRGEPVPIEIAGILERKHGVTPMTEQSLAQATETAMVQRIDQARWLAELKPQDRQSLAHLSIRYGLDPLMRELTIYEGAPYITIGGLIRIAHRQKLFAGLEDRPMTTAERQQYGYKAPVTWIVKVYRKDWHCPAIGTGTADPATPLRNNPVERVRPEWLARSRAIRQALKLAFPHSLPFDEMASAEDVAIDPETGEILDGALVEVPEQGPALESQPDAPDLPGEMLVAPSEDEPERANADDMREKIATLRGKLGSTDTQIEAWCKKNLGCGYGDASLDGLTQLRDALAASTAKKAAA